MVPALPASAKGSNKPMSAIDRSWYESKKFLAFALTCGILLACVYLGSSTIVQEKLGDAIMFGLPVLLGGQSLIDARVRPAALQAASSTDQTAPSTSVTPSTVKP